MRKVVIYSLLSADGVAESPDRYVFAFDEVMYDNLRRVIEAQDAVLLGRVSYDEWAPYWPSADDEPFASFINGVQKHVVTSSQPQTPWAGSTVVEGPVADHVRDLKQQPGGDIGVHGSITLAQFLLREGLADELRLVVSPAVVGEGRRLFENGPGLVHLELIRASGTPSGAVLVDYRVRDGA